ncbi:DUF4262 domain-containing protein [Xanthomonas phage BUDD]|nr:DUF4262 domain-containing protein [Xanthomonas phage BUDD]
MEDAIRLMLDLELMTKIEMYGYTMVGVFDPEGNDPGFVYTIGLTERGWPEVIMIGNIHPMIAEQFLADMIAKWGKAEKVIMGDNLDVIQFQDRSVHPIRVIDVNQNKAAENYAIQAKRFYPEHNVKYVQALIPDRFGRFPDEPEYDQSKQAQPIIK